MKQDSYTALLVHSSNLWSKTQEIKVPGNQEEQKNEPMEPASPPLNCCLPCSILTEGISKFYQLYASKMKSKAYKGLVLIGNNEDGYELRNYQQTLVNIEEDKIYDFVIMPDNQIRIGNGHTFLSACAKEVRYAGEIQFRKEGDRVKISQWNNKSGAYKPSAEIAAIAGFDLSKFDPIIKTEETTDSLNHSFTHLTLH